MFRDLVLKNRSYRRFCGGQTISLDTLRALVDLARLTPSGANLQSLKYLLSNEVEKNACIFPNLLWAGYLKAWEGPEVGERPSAYVVMLHDKHIAKHCGCDHGIAAQTLLLGAAEQGIGGCMIGSILRPQLAEALGIDQERYDLMLVIALGFPKETIVLESKPANGSIKYWRDPDDVHHVPKRDLDEVILD